MPLGLWPPPSAPENDEIYNRAEENKIFEKDDEQKPSENDEKQNTFEERTLKRELRP